MSKSVLKEENKTRILYDLLAISVCPIVINRHKFIDEYFRATSYRLREKWLEQIFRVSLFYIPVIYYYTLDLLSENIADENKLKALLEQDKELFDSEMTKCISSLSDSMPKEINQCYDIDFKTVYTNFHKYVKANYLHFWQEKISDARISVSNNIEPVYYDHDLIKVVQQFQNSKRMFINRYHKYNEKEIERTLEKRIRNIFDDNLMERMHLLTDKQILAMVTGIIEEILDERYNEYASVFKNLRFEKVNGAKKIKNINDLKDKEIILGKTMEFICSNSENIKQILENYIMKSYKMTSDSIEYKKIRKLCYVIRAFNKEFVEKYGDKADCPELINYDNLSLDKEIENYNALDNA